jgi:hypothetical protein
MMSARFVLPIVAIFIASHTSLRAADNVDFNRDIRPLLSDHCYQCHGPDEKQRKAKLRLDTKDGLFTKREDGIPVVPSHLDQSDLYRRITAKNENERMPPPDKGKKLTETQIALLKRWIEQGAQYKGHWAYIAPTRPETPNLQHPAWQVRNPIDRFILAKLEHEGLTPSAEADKVMLIRRLTLDLTGLPPTIQEVDEFLKDNSPNAYEKVVDRLLASPRYGERMALEWLDAARYADTHGYHIDSGRNMTRWREYVIESFNNNLPFDQFTIEQLAGDLLPNATTRQKVASGFNRNHMINFEGGAIPEEYHNAYIVDRVNTTSTVWLGLTMACTQCHDHKFDPLTTKDFYRFYAFFHNVPERGLDGNTGNAVPSIKAPSSADEKRIQDLRAEITALEASLKAAHPELDHAQAEWEKKPQASRTEWTTPAADKMTARGATLKALADKSIVAEGANPATETYTVTFRTELAKITALRLEVFPQDNLPAKGPGRSDNGNFVMTGFRVFLGDDKKGGGLGLKSATADFAQATFPVSGVLNRGPGWAIHPEVGKPHWAIFELETPLVAPGKEITVQLQFNSQFAHHQFGKFRLSATDSASPLLPETMPEKIRMILAVAAEKRTEAQKTELRNHYREVVSPEMRQIRDKIAKAQALIAATQKKIPDAMVMEEMTRPRDTFVLIRGAYDKKGEKVTAGTPAILPPLPKDAPANRLGLAKWLMSADNPLTSRVVVNRYWQMYFGTGLAKTSEDFGSQGEPPSHPELLDWLAVEFRESGWNVKHVQKLIVMSATYRQSSLVSKELLARDPENRLLGRMTRLRLQAEFIRDQALAVSGLLNGEIGGASVSPYQPAGLWEELMSRSDGDNWTAQKYKQSSGKDLYRRTMYTFWKRTCPPPALATLDAPDRETCVVRRSRTNTPLQALVLMNDPTYVEASRKLAERIMTEGGKSAEEQLVFAFKMVVARKPSEKEISILKQVLAAQRKKFATDRVAAEKLLKVGESPRNDKLDPAELAAWAMVSNTLLNLDETVTRN